MKKDVTKLKATRFDLVIIGGGIHGSILALEAARTGSSVALVEKGDFGNSTSANSLKIVHGGIRYIQHGNLKRMRESIVSRRSMMTFAPHLVKPLACLMPTYGHGIKGREALRFAFGLYDLIAFDRNKGLERDIRLPTGMAVSADVVKWAVPGINDDNLSGGAIWHDAMAENTERLILEYVKEAARYGAVVANYVEAIDIETEDEQVTAIIAKDHESGDTTRIRCKSVVNATGPWVARLTKGQPELSGQLWATAVNLIVKKRLFKKYAVGLEGYTDYTDKDAIIKRGKRLFFFVPWQNQYTMIGTTYKPYSGSADDFVLKKDELQEVLDDVNNIYPAGDLTIEDVTFFHGGLLPMNVADKSQNDSVQLDKASRIIDHGTGDNINGLFSIKGVKYTTAPIIAQKVVKILQKEGYLGRYTARSIKADFPASLDSSTTVAKLGGGFKDVKEYLQVRYGANWREVFKYLAREDILGAEDSLWVTKEPSLMKMELLYFLREEMACTLADVMFRRTSLASAECPDDKILVLVSAIMAEELGWSDDKRRQQIDLVRQVFAPLLS